MTTATTTEPPALSRAGHRRISAKLARIARRVEVLHTAVVAGEVHRDKGLREAARLEARLVAIRSELKGARDAD